LGPIALVLGKRQSEEQHAGDRVVVVRLYLAETERSVQRNRAGQRGQRVQADSAIPRGSRGSEDLLGQPATESKASERVADEQSLDLAHLRIIKRSQRDAAGRASAIDRQPDPARGPAISSWQAGKLLVEPLEAQVDAQSVCVLAEQLADDG